MLSHPCILRDPQQRGAKSEVAASPLPSRVPKRGRKCYITPAFSGIPTKGNKIKSGPQLKGTKSEVAASPLPSRGPKRGQKCYATPAFSGILYKGEQNQKWLPHPCLLGCPKEGRNATSPLHYKRKQNQKWQPQPCLLGGPKEGRNATPPLHSRGSPTKGSKIRSGCLTPAFSGAQKRAEMLRHRCIFGDPNKGEQNQKWSPTKGSKIRSGCLTPAFSGAQKRAEMLRHPCILRDPQQRGAKSEVVASPLPSRVPKRGRKCYITPAFSGIPTKGNKIRSGPQQRGAKSEVAASPLPSRGPKKGQKCYVTPAFSGSPTPSAKQKLEVAIWVFWGTLALTLKKNNIFFTFFFTLA